MQGESKISSFVSRETIFYVKEGKIFLHAPGIERFSFNLPPAVKKR